jgi:hypothetical protein
MNLAGGGELARDESGYGQSCRRRFDERILMNEI